MTDPDVQREEEANRRRHVDEDDGDNSIVDSVEAAIDPITRVIRGPNDEDEEDVEARREANDAEQRPGNDPNF